MPRRARSQAKRANSQAAKPKKAPKSKSLVPSPEKEETTEPPKKEPKPKKQATTARRKKQRISSEAFAEKE